MIVSTWTGREVRALRETALRMTQPEFGELVGFTTAAVQKWEYRSTTERPVRGRSAEALDTVFARLTTEQRARFEEVCDSDGSPRDEPRARLDIQENDVKRREFGKLAAAVVAAVAPPEDRRRIGMTDAQRLLDEVGVLTRQDQQSGGGALMKLAVRMLTQAKERLETGAFDAKAGNAFTRATGELAVLTGWLAYDGDQQALAQRCYAEAMALGTEADDIDLIAHTCLFRANQSYFLARSHGGGSPSKVLQLADRAGDLMRRRPPGRIHALIAIRQAQAYGLMGFRSEFDRAIATAWRELDIATEFEPVEEIPDWLRFVTYSEVAGHEARGCADIGDMTRCVELYGAAVERTTATRNSVNLRAWLASAQAQAGDLRGAFEAGGAVLAELAELSSTRTLRVLEPVRFAAERDAIGADFHDQFRAVEQRVITA